MGFDPVAYINEPRWRAMSLGLGRIRLLLELLGRPQDALRFVHVAGTNGKGSVCAYVASVLQEAGLRTGLFTSPYIEAFEERIRVDGDNIGPQDLLQATLAVREQACEVERRRGEHPTEFELMCAVALTHFARSGCDVVVMEVGLGGRLDATNVIDAPEAAVIARIGLDHTALLGDTIEEVAAEKAGIVKPGVPVVSWPQEPAAMAVVRRAASSCGSSLVVPDFDELAMEGVRPGPDGVPVRPFSYKGQALETRLLGSYQPRNAALALEALRVLRGRGWDIPDEAMRRGVARTTWPGRFEVLAAHDGPTVVVDGGHNPQGAQALAESLRDVFPGRCPVFVVGVLADKDYVSMLRHVAPLASAFVACAPDNPRALPAEDLACALRGLGAACPVRVAADVGDAVGQACLLAGPDGLVCAFGSLYGVGAVRAATR